MTDFVLDNIINHSDEINIYSDMRNFDFENKNLTKKNVSIFTDKNIDDNLKKICETSDVLFFLSDSDPFNVFSYKKCLVYNPSTKSVFQITDRDIYEMYKDKKYPVDTQNLALESMQTVYKKINEQDLENLYDNYTQLHLQNMKSKIEMALDD